MDSTLEQHRSLMLDLQQRHRVLAQLIGGRRVAYLDIPVHGNIGDLLIYLGTLAFLRKHSIAVATSAAYFNCKIRQTADVVLLHGGGNFGDLYPAHQRLRERIVEANPDKRIIALPQTVYFSTDAAFQRARASFSQHPDLHICVRDETSFENVRGLSANILRLPDMAHQLYPLPLTRARVGGKDLVIRRRDIESAGNGWSARSEAGATADWADLVGRRKSTILLARALASTPLGRLGRARFATWWERYARRLVDDASALYSLHDRVQTDRLHGHILACLMDMRSVVYDNRYGKNAGYVRAWTGGSPLVELNDHGT